jgi:hypothetical protein
VPNACRYGRGTPTRNSVCLEKNDEGMCTLSGKSATVCTQSTIRSLAAELMDLPSAENVPVCTLEPLALLSQTRVSASHVRAAWSLVPGPTRVTLRAPPETARKIKQGTVNIVAVIRNPNMAGWKS